ncbi:MAG TPA: hypothetical protein PLZ21_01045 [Armatimonadota bacterium]|nr:hypothetical protein [Armatimonadota bacterium]
MASSRGLSRKTFRNAPFLAVSSATGSMSVARISIIGKPAWLSLIVLIRIASE